MRYGFKLWWKDQKETWEFAKRHPFMFATCMIFLFMVFKLIGL